MINLTEFAWVLLVSAVVTFVLTCIYPTRSGVRQGAWLATYVAVAAACAFFLFEHYGISAVLAGDARGYVVIGVLGFIGVGIMLMTIDLYINFDALKDDPAYAIFGRSGLAVSMLVLAVTALAAISIAWHQIDPTIFEARSNIVFLTAAGAPAELRFNDFMLFALDQTQKALFFDISEVYRVGLIDIGNNPEHYPFSTVCLVYRTYLSVFVVFIVVRLLRQQ